MQLNFAPAEFSKYNLSVHEPTTQAASEPSTLEATVLQQWPDVLARSQPSATWSSRKFRESDDELIYAARLQAQQAGASLRMQLRAEHAARFDAEHDARLRRLHGKSGLRVQEQRRESRQREVHDARAREQEQSAGRRMREQASRADRTDAGLDARLRGLEACASEGRRARESRAAKVAACENQKEPRPARPWDAACEPFSGRTENGGKGRPSTAINSSRANLARFYHLDGRKRI